VKSSSLTETTIIDSYALAKEQVHFWSLFHYKHLAEGTILFIFSNINLAETQFLVIYWYQTSGRRSIFGNKHGITKPTIIDSYTLAKETSLVLDIFKLKTSGRSAKFSPFY